MGDALTAAQQSTFASLLHGSAQEHAALVALLEGSGLRTRAACPPLPPALFADAQRLAEGRDGRQRKEGKLGKTKVPLKGIAAGPPDTSAFWLLSEVRMLVCSRKCRSIVPFASSCGYQTCLLVPRLRR